MRVLTLLFAGTLLFAAPIDDYLAQLAQEAKKADPNFAGFDARRGERIFTTTRIGKRGEPISCASCHTKDLTKEGENVFTGKKIAPLAPRANPERLTDIKRVKKWLRRNFKDVYKREGTPQEKGDVLVYILNY